MSSIKYTAPTSGVYTVTLPQAQAGTTLTISGAGGGGGGGGSGYITANTIITNGSSSSTWDVSFPDGVKATDRGILKKCASCNKKKEAYVSYTPYKITRYICQKCHFDAIDRYYGVVTPKSEKVLYGK